VFVAGSIAIATATIDWSNSRVVKTVWLTRCATAQLPACVKVLCFSLYRIMSSIGLSLVDCLQLESNPDLHQSLLHLPWVKSRVGPASCTRAPASSIRSLGLTDDVEVRTVRRPMNVRAQPAYNGANVSIGTAQV